MPSVGGYYPNGLTSILTGLESNRACVGYAWPTNCSLSTPPTCLPELRRALLDEWCNILQDQIDNLILSMPRRSTRRILAMDHVILNHGQETCTTPKLAPPSPNYNTTPTGGLFNSQQI
ncbi:uncharacterized protein TNCV_3965671 [Trichonephila clavipes]|nr:uncharacterized protein TNCV_3965671 [Trichonephila clavipes]